MKDYFNGRFESDKLIIHLYLLNQCNHHCKWCCNKEYSVNSIPTITAEELGVAETVCLTGGEPFLLPEVCDIAKSIKSQYPNIKTVYVYTCGDSLYQWLTKHGTLHDIDGVNISPKNRYDSECVNAIFSNSFYRDQILGMWSNRIYLFPNVRDLVKDQARLNSYESIEVINREWQTEFEPDSGIFRRLPILLDK